MPFNYQGAIDAGYKDDEIKQYLKQTNRNPDEIIPKKPSLLQKGADFFGVPKTLEFIQKGESIGPVETVTHPIETAKKLAGPATELTTSAIANVVGGALFQKFLAPLGAPAAKFLTEKVAPAIVQMSLSEGIKETGKKITRRIAGEVGEEVFGETIKRPTKELSRQVVEKNVKGTAGSLVKQAQINLRNISGEVDAALKGLPDKPDLPKILLNAVQRADEAMPGAAATNKLLELADDILQKNKDIAWDGLLSLRQNLDKLGKGKAAEEIAAVLPAFRNAFADAIRSEFPSQIANKITEMQFWKILSDVASKKAAEGFLSRGDIFTLLVGGAPSAFLGAQAFGPVGGAVAGATSVGALKAAHSPLAGTTAAQVVKSIPGVVGGTVKKVTQGVAQAGKAKLQQMFQ